MLRSLGSQARTLGPGPPVNRDGSEVLRVSDQSNVEIVLLLH